MTTITSHFTTSISPPPENNAMQPCTVCHRQISGPDRQNHMGGHILRKLRGVVENEGNNPGTVSFIHCGTSSSTGLNMYQVSMMFPCGFCGQLTDQRSHCQLQPIKGGKVYSGCSQVYNFQIAAASKISKQKACTNVPLQCRFCAELHWKYNMVFHLRLKHPRWEENVSEKEREGFRCKILIDTEEETKLGIPEDLHGHWVDASEVYDTRRMGILPNTSGQHGDSPRRLRQPAPPPGQTQSVPFQLYSGINTARSPPARNTANVFV